MAKSGKGGEKIPFKESSPAQKRYWDVLVGKKKIKPEQLPQSFSYNLYKLKAYLNEIEAAFSSDVPYDNRYVSILPIAYDEKGTVSALLTPSVLSDDGVCINQFNQEEQKKKAKRNKAKSGSSPTPPPPPTDAFNSSTDWP